MREQFERGQQPSGNQQRLGDRRVPDGFGVGCCAVMPEIKARYRREPIEPVSEGGYVEPGPEKPWCLGTLTGRHNRKHICTISWPGRKRRTGTPRIFGRPIVTSRQFGSGPPLAHRAVLIPPSSSLFARRKAFLLARSSESADARLGRRSSAQPTVIRGLQRPAALPGGSGRRGGRG